MEAGGAGRWAGGGQPQQQPRGAGAPVHHQHAHAHHHNQGGPPHPPGQPMGVAAPPAPSAAQLQVGR